MFNILYDGKIIAASDGGAEFAYTSGKIKKIKNAGGTLKFTLPHGHQWSGRLPLLQGIISVEQNGIERFFGRALKYEVNYYGDYTYTCEGGLSFLNDVNTGAYNSAGTIGSSSISSTAMVVSWLNDQIMRSGLPNSFYTWEAGSVTSDDLKHLYEYYDALSGSQTMLDMCKDFADAYGGTWEAYRNQNSTNIVLSYASKGAHTCSQEIAINDNLIDFKLVADASSVVTRTGAILKNTPSGSNSTPNWRYYQKASTAEDSVFPYIDGEYQTANTQLNSTPSNAVTDALSGSYFSADAVADYAAFTAAAPTETITVKALDKSVQYPAQYETFEPGYIVRLFSPFHGIDDTLEVNSVTVDLSEPSAVSVGFGSRQALTREIIGLQR